MIIDKTYNHSVNRKEYSIITDIPEVICVGLFSSYHQKIKNHVGRPCVDENLWSSGLLSFG